MPISPNQGSTGGGTLVTTTATDVSPTQVTAVSPSGTGSVGVTMATAGGTSNPVPCSTSEPRSSPRSVRPPAPWRATTQSRSTVSAWQPPPG